VTELDALSNGLRTVFDGQFLKKLTAIVLAHATRPAVASVSWQMLVELLSTTILGVCISVDRFVTHSHRMALQSHPACDLFRRPSGVKTAAYGSHNTGISDQLAMDGATLFVFVLRAERMIAVQLRLIIKAHRVPLDLAVDCRGIATQPVSDF